MQYRQIPKTDISVSPWCVGTMSFGIPIAEPDAIKILHHALDKGVNFIDTANMYQGYTRSLGSPGEVSENIIGKALKGRRDQAVLATKVGMKVGDAPEDEFASPAAIRKHLDKSLQRLDTDFVDIYYLHKPDPVTPLAETIGALKEATDAGKIKYYGVSNFSAQQLQELLDAADTNNLPRPVICQPMLNLMFRDNLTELLPLCEKESIAVTPFRTLNGGLLTGRYKRGEQAPAGSRKSEAPGWLPELNDELFDEIETYEKQAEEAGLSMTHYAIKWTLSCPAVVAVVLSAGTIEQVDDVIVAASS